MPAKFPSLSGLSPMARDGRRGRCPHRPASDGPHGVGAGHVIVGAGFQSRPCLTGRQSKAKTAPLQFPSKIEGCPDRGGVCDCVGAGFQSRPQEIAS